MRPRNELVRFAKTKASAMRNANTGNPDAVQVSVRGQHTDGRYIVRRDHWPCDILVPSSPRDAAIPYPRRMPMGFEDGNAQKPVLYWLQRRPIPVGGPLGSALALTLNWVCAQADFARSSSYTTASWAYTTATEITPLVEETDLLAPEVQFPRFLDTFRCWFVPRYFVEDPREDPEDPFEEPYYHADADSPEGYVAVGPCLVVSTPGDLVRAHDMRDMVSGDSFFDNLDWTTFAADSLCIAPTGEPILGWRCEDTVEGERWIASVFYDAASEFYTAGLRKHVFFAEPPRNGVDVIVCGDYVCAPLESTGGTHYLAVCELADGAEVNATNVELTGDHVGLIGRVWPVTPDSHPQTWTNGTLVFAQDGSGGTYGVDPAAGALEWVYDGDKAIVPLAFVAGRGLLCAWEETTTTTITDSLIVPEWEGATVTVDNERDAAGHSLKAGLIYLSATTGAESGAGTLLPGTEDAGPLMGPITDYVVEITGPVYTSPDAIDLEFDEDADIRWYTGFGGFKALVLADLLAPGWEPDEDTATDAYTALSTSFSAIYGSDTGPKLAWRDIFFALYEEWREAEVARIDALVAGRLDVNDWIRAECWEARVPLTDDDYNPLGYGRYYGETINATAPTSDFTARQFNPTEFAGFTSEDEEDLTGLDISLGWVTDPGNKTFRFDYQYVLRNDAVSIGTRTRTVAPLHGMGPVAIGLGIVLFPGTGADPTWSAYSLSTLGHLWDYTPTTTGSIYVGNAWIDAAGVHVSWSDGGTNFAKVLNASTGAILGTPTLPGDMIDQVFDGATVHDAAGRYALGPA